MRKVGKENKGRPGASNKSEGTGLSDTMQDQNLKQNKEMTEKYLKSEDEISDHVRKENPNRNTGKEDATNAGGYQH